MLSHITPVILTLNEEPNLRRTLSALDWAQRIIVVDSGSTDSTLALLAADSRIIVFSRKFDTHGAQWKFAISQTNISTDWVLRLDADYIVTPELRDELATLDSNAPVSAYRVAFDYAIYGRRLRGTLYPPNTVLFRRGCAAPFDQGHTEAWAVEGAVADLRGRILHDDRKPMERWIPAQARYMARELPHMKRDRRGFKRALRTTPPLMPLLSFFYCLFFKGLVLDGRPGLFYSLQRLLAETALALMVLEDQLKPAERLDPAGGVK
jgi:glycosyltransferase involved in cell wall biosynthesis